MLFRSLLLPVPDKLPTCNVAPILPTLALPETDKELRIPKLVMLGCAAVINVPVSRLAPIVPLFAYTFPARILPDTDRLVPVAAPMIGVVNVGVVALTKFPVPVPVYSAFVR